MEMQLQEYTANEILKLGVDPELESETRKNDVVEFTATPDQISWTTKNGKSETVDIRRSGKNQFTAECDTRTSDYLNGLDVDILALPMILSFKDGESDKVLSQSELLLF